MSRQRLEAILGALTARHWELLPADQHENASVDPFRLEKEEIVWAIRRGEGPVVELCFWATGPLGGPTRDLGDILHCTVRSAPEIQLHFSKIKTQEWQDGLRQFVWDVEDHCKRVRKP